MGEQSNVTVAEGYERRRISARCTLSRSVAAARGNQRALNDVLHNVDNFFKTRKPS